MASSSMFRYPSLRSWSHSSNNVTTSNDADSMLSLCAFQEHMTREGCHTMSRTYRLITQPTQFLLGKERVKRFLKCAYSQWKQHSGESS